MTHATRLRYRLLSRRLCRLVTIALLGTGLGVSSAQAQPVAGDVAAGSLKGKTLTFTSYGGMYQDGQIAALQDFVQRSGVRLISDGPVEIAKVQAQVRSGNVTWDVVDTGDLTPYVYCGTLFQKLDFSKLDVSNIPSGQVGPCSVPAMNYSIVLMVKNGRYPNPPKSWRDFFDVENFPGVRAIDHSGELRVGFIEQAILAAGGSADNLTVADIDRGLDKIRALGPDTIFWKTGAESQQLAESGEADMLMMWGGRAMTAVKNGADYSPVWQDWLVVMDQITIPVGVKDPDAAYALINAYLGQRAQEIMAEKTTYTPIHKDARPKVDALTAAWMTNTPERIAQGYQANLPFWVEHYRLAFEKWNDMAAGQ